MNQFYNDEILIVISTRSFPLSRLEANLRKTRKSQRRVENDVTPITYNYTSDDNHNGF